MIDKIKQKLKSLDEKKLMIVAVGVIIGALIIGALTINLIINFGNLFSGNGFAFYGRYLYSPVSILVGLAVGALVWFITRPEGRSRKGIFKRGKDGGDVGDSVLENSRFMTSKERAANFGDFFYEDIAEQKKDGVPVMACLNSKKKLEISIMSGAHALIIGSTGSGKTTTFINPMVQLLGASSCGSSMILTDPKGELFDLHSKFLKDRGYDVYVLDLRDTYESSRWNPLDPIWDMYQEYIRLGREIYVHRDNMADYPNLKRRDGEAAPGSVWAEWEGRAYSDVTLCADEAAVAKQKIYDEMYEDLTDLVSGICPIVNDKDPLWEKGARSIIQAVILAMLEDSEDPALEMTREKFNFFNVNKILTNSEDDYKALRDYFQYRNPLSQAYTMSRQVLAAAKETMSSYMSITYDKLNIFNDRGICGLTSATDINAASIAEKPTALFIKIPDEKDTRHSLASLFILSTYKALIKVATAREDLALPRNVYFIMDEFGNMPRIEKFDKMITVGRSRKIWFSMVVQSYAQLNNVYGETCANIIKSNCAMKMFIGSNDIETCKEFSELCGNKTVRTSSSSAQLGSKEGDISVSTQIQTRPLIYPSELQKLNNKNSTGNAIIVTFGNYPLKTRYTPSYETPQYTFGRMDTGDTRSRVFRAESRFYDISKRNALKYLASLKAENE